ncbi:MAG: type II toxin-antitoxin system HicB family antitoxin [Bacteroidetes bacterium]|nr:type II toxin-antitoxin system HicB family antitoxin [Bacteroidota bacterium]
MKLEVIIERDQTGYFVAEVPALPGCLSQGKTLAEAEENIKEAIELWLDVMKEKSHYGAIHKKDKKYFRKRIAVEV